MSSGNLSGQTDDIGAISAAEETFERWRRIVGIFAAPLAFLITYWLCAGLTPPGRSLSAILAVVGVLWVCETVALPVTAIFGAALCILLGVADVKRVFSAFGDPIVFVFIGSFMLAAAMAVHGLDRRIALALLSIPGFARSPAGILAGMGLVTAVISMWVSNTATTAMMLPIGLGILAALHRLRVQQGLATGNMDARAWPFATAMMLMIAYGASIGGIGTPVGSPPNLIGIGFLRTAAKVEFSFFQWMLVAVPLLVVMFIVLLVVLLFLFRKGTAMKLSGDDLSRYIAGERAKLGPWTPGQRNALIAFIIAITLWMLPGILALPGLEGSAAEKWVKARLPESVVAILAAVLLFALPIDRAKGTFTLTWKQAAGIDWGTILLFGGGLAMGGLMVDTGVAKAMGEAMTARIGSTSLWGLTGVAIAFGIILSEATSNTAAANMVVPVVIAIAQSAGIDPVPPTLGAVLGCSYGFMLPVSTPPNAIAYASGLIPIGRMIRAGVVFDILGFFVIWAGLRLIWPWVG